MTLIRRWKSTVVTFLGWVLFAGAIAWPILALSIQCTTEHRGLSAEILPTGRVFGLLARSAILAITAAALTVAMAIPIAWNLSRHSPSPTRYWHTGFMAAILLCPPMIYAFAWNRITIWPAIPWLRTLLIWCLWAWPIPVLLLASSWARAAHSVCEAARLEASAWKTFLHAGLATQRSPIALAICILSILFITDHAVPHACGHIVFATELLGWATNSSKAIDVVVPVTLLLPPCMVFAYLALWFSRPMIDADYGEFPRTKPGGGIGHNAIIWGPILISVLPPVMTFLFGMRTQAHATSALRIYSGDALWSVILAGAAGLGAAVMAVGVAALARFRRTATASVLIFGIMPGALAGAAVVHGYNNSWGNDVYSHWPALLLAEVARYGWIGQIMMVVLLRRGRGLIEQAQLDGATRSRAVVDVLAPAYGRAVLWSGAIAGMLALGEISASSLVRSPDFNPISLILMEKFHRFEDEALCTISLMLMGFAMLIGLMGSLVRRSAIKSS